MKRILFFALCLLVSHCIIAQHITPKEAQQIALQFVNENHQRTRTAPDARQVYQANYDNSSCYVFNVGKEDGFIIVSADNRTDKILGYTTKGSFQQKHIPEALQWWLNCYDEQIQALKKYPTTRAVAAETTERRRIEPLIKTKWDQGRPYNLSAPKIGALPTYTGCVATAMAQLLYYHQSPQTPVPSIPAYITASRDIDMPALKPTTFKWQDMRPIYKEDAEGDTAQAVAQLMLYCGQAVKMDFNTNGSGAYIDESVFSKYFGFTPGAREISRSDKTLSQWEQMIYDELKAGRPVLYTGGKISGSHAFVCDGYDGSGKFHINWGWGGMSDGFFKLSVLDPIAEGLGGILGAEGYTLSQTAVVHLRTDTTAITPQDEDIRMTVKEVYLYQTYDTRKSTSNVFRISHLTMDGYHLTSSMRSFELAWGLYQDNTLLSVLDSKSINNLTPDYTASTSWALEFGANLPDGIYQLRPLCRLKGDEAWQPCIDSDLHFVELKINGLRLYITMRNDAADKIKLNSINFRGKKTVNQPVEVALDITNEGRDNNPELYLFVNGQLTTGTASSIDPGKTGEVALSFIPYYAGKYRIRICRDRAGRRLLVSDTLTISQGKIAKLACMARITNANNETKVLQGTTLRCHLSITNQGTETYSAPILCRLYKVIDGFGYPVETWQEEIALEPNSAKGFDCEFKNLEDGEQYTVIVSYFTENKETDGEQTDVYTISTTTGIKGNGMEYTNSAKENISIFTLQGIRVKEVKRQELMSVMKKLPKGIYIVEGRKYQN